MLWSVILKEVSCLCVVFVLKLISSCAIVKLWLQNFCCSRGEVVTTPLPPSNCSLCFCVPAFLPSHSLFCPELGRNDKSKTENKLLESFSNTVNARKYILLVWKMNSFCFMMHLLGALLMPSMMNDTFSFLLCCYFAKSSQNSCSWKMERIYSLVVTLERHLPQDLFFR